MSTNSSITLKTGKNRYETIYCHWNGYLECNGFKLIHHFKNKRKIKKLLKLEGLSTLESKIYPRKNIPHSFDHPQRDVCVSYYRDRKEDIVHNVVNSRDEVDYQEYDYLFENSTWYVKSMDTDGEFIKLSDAIVQEENK